MKIYIAGPMTGLPDFNYPAFNAAATMLRAAGHMVENPAENPDPACKSWAGYMRLALAQLVTCEGIFMLKGWERSKGACIEFDLAKALNIELMFENGAASGNSQDEMEPMAYVLGDPRYADSSNVFMSHQFTPDGEHEEEWTPLFTAAAIAAQVAAAFTNPAHMAVAESDHVQLIGVKADGTEHDLGNHPMPPRMKARKLAVEQFGHFEDGDGSDADMCMYALEAMLDYFLRYQEHTVLAPVAEKHMEGQELPISTLLNLESGFFAGRWVEAEQMRALVECCKERFGGVAVQKGGA